MSLLFSVCWLFPAWPVIAPSKNTDTQPAAPLPPSGRVTAAGVESLTSAKGWVQEELKRRLKEVAPQLSSMMQQWSLWGLRKHDEWLYLAVTPPQSKGFAFTESACPELYNSYISMLFVGLTDNTPVVCSPSPPALHLTPCPHYLGAVCFTVSASVRHSYGRACA